ncbi:MAG: cytidine/deoxycytidylate deaminase family protein [Chlamydiales bacterium]|jgi:tRNA(Arg) A34 adenosine deaminase TadA|nr:cytidine/deoxycytidylate deaminase family protein [Chlamydiales bacterium]
MESLFMQKAIESAQEGIRAEEGGPFGACIVKDGTIISIAHNTVLKDHDPTCHAEMNAIRQASKALNSHILSGCELYTTAEPCPMCLAAIYWSRIEKFHVGVPKECAARYGFDDDFFYQEISKATEERSIEHVYDVMSQECEAVFAEWEQRNGQLY